MSHPPGSRIELRGQHSRVIFGSIYRSTYPGSILVDMLIILVDMLIYKQIM